MRVRTYHRHRVNKSSPLLAALVIINVAYSFFFAFPIVAASLGNRWYRGITSSQQTWCVLIAVCWFLAELPRLYFGHTSNSQQYVPGLICFLGLTLLPQLPLVILYNVMWPQPDSLNYAVSITMLILLVAEFLCSVKLLGTSVKSNQIDYFVYTMHAARE
ncbi:hypothetical protein TraAM80_00038 [Trypanosoma rangeli]|uniref:Uncharacterized protein n=1 Tax=Trypanosoma rangeli TaxID=5698 RepID=A0A3R7LEN3_TRYRA|nr:uncharacterized protein TraAM80_00038 [Trypanosoma rangeli]RNF12881.1 hypothetical protein TraAM80_00038 [Trypanosoma rangeli]|eukprot:RNF12881.1 hypothetical protein TraAM80_00038 [Trypanosoma rangeli]